MQYLDDKIAGGQKGMLKSVAENTKQDVKHSVEDDAKKGVEEGDPEIKNN